MALLLSDCYNKSNKAAFLAKVREVSIKLAIAPDWLMAVMYKESSLDAQARNTLSGATGLIQFMPATAVGLGTTVAALYEMDEIRQLDYVYKYFKRYTLRLNSYADLYRVVFFPLSIGKPAEWVFQAKGLSAALIARQNPAIDLNGDGQITNAEFERYIYKGFSQATTDLLKKKYMNRVVIKWGIIVSFAALLTFSAIMIYKTIKTEKK